MLSWQRLWRTKHAAGVAEGMDFDAVCASGDLAPIKKWLGSRIWTWGRAKDSRSLSWVHAVSDVHYYTKYLTDKYSRLWICSPAHKRPRRGNLCNYERDEMKSLSTRVYPAGGNVMDMAIGIIVAAHLPLLLPPCQ